MHTLTKGLDDHGGSRHTKGLDDHGGLRHTKGLDDHGGSRKRGWTCYTLHV
jgi:hypothetical protein